MRGLVRIRSIASFDHLSVRGRRLAVLTLIAGPPDGSITMCSLEFLDDPIHVASTHLDLRLCFLVLFGLRFGLANTCSPNSIAMALHSLPLSLL